TAWYTLSKKPTPSGIGRVSEDPGLWPAILAWGFRDQARGAQPDHRLRRRWGRGLRLRLGGDHVLRLRLGRGADLRAFAGSGGGSRDLERLGGGHAGLQRDLAHPDVDDGLLAQALHVRLVLLRRPLRGEALLDLGLHF